MPVRNPSYNIPPFPPTGDANIDKALNSWRADFGGLYQRNLFEAEQLPTFYATAKASTMGLTTAYQAYISSTVGLQGNERMLLIASLEIQTTGVGVDFFPHVTYPSGTTQSLSSFTPSFNQNTTNVTLRNTITGHWPLNPRIQIGGKHVMDIQARVNTPGAVLTTVTRVVSGAFSIFVF